MTSANVVDSAKCPHCRESFDEANVMNPADDVVALVCPHCDTMLGSSVGRNAYNELLALLLSNDLQDAEEVIEALEKMDSAESPSAISDEAIEIINDRMGRAQVTID